MPKHSGKQKTEKKKKEDRKLVIPMAKLRMAHASTHGARKPPGLKTLSCANLSKLSTTASP